MTIAKWPLSSIERPISVISAGSGQIKERTKKFAVSIVRFCSALPQRDDYRIIGKQLIRSGCSVGANYRSACLAKSRADFISKLAIVEEEADESMYWLEIIQEMGLKNGQLSILHEEARQILAMTIASKKTARLNGQLTMGN